MFASPNFKQLYTKIATSEVDHVLPNQANKLRCLIHYFNRVNDSSKYRKYCGILMIDRVLIMVLWQCLKGL